MALDRLTVLILVKLGRDQIGQGFDGLCGVRSTSLQLQPCAALRSQGGQVENALSVELIAIVMDPDLGLIAEARA